MNAQYAARADAPSHAAGHTPLRDHVSRSVRRYLQDINGCELDDLYEVVLREVEAPLFAEVMRYCEGNQSRAAACLGINRATLRKKLKNYSLA